MYEAIAIFDTLGDEPQEVMATVRLYEGRPAKLYGPPEDCYPEEPAEVEVFDPTIAGMPYKASDEEVERWQTLVLESPEDYFSFPVDDDPTPWCIGCGSMTIKGCQCGPYAANH